MKAKELINIFQACNPESEVLCKWMGDTQRDTDYRMACSWLVLNDENPSGTGGDALQSFSIVGAELERSDEAQLLEGMMCTLSLDQDFYEDYYVYETMVKLKGNDNDKK